MAKNQKPFTEEEDQFLRDHYGTKTIKQLCEEMERSTHSINNRIRRLGLREAVRIRSPWTEEEDAYLREYFNKQSAKEIGAHLGRTPNSVSSRIRILDLRLEPICRKWTENEDEYLMKNYGVRKLSAIAKKLGRTMESVEKRIGRLGLGGVRTHIANFTSYELAAALGVDPTTIYRWAEQQELPYKMIQKEEVQIMTIEVNSFWKWASSHKELLNFNRIEKGVLVPEPAWVHEQRKIDFEQRPQQEGRPWTTEEDERLWTLFYQHGLTQKEIGKLIGRSENGVQRRLTRIRQQRSKKKTA